MNPFAQILGLVRAPVWHGERRVHRLIGEAKPGRYGKRWVPWTLLVPGVSLPTSKVAAGCWALLHGRA